MKQAVASKSNWICERWQCLFILLSFWRLCYCT